MASVSTYWRTLSLGDQLLWTATANTQTRYNRFGVPYTPTGFQLFCELTLNVNLITPNTFNTTPPTLPSLPSITSPSCIIDVSSSAYYINGTVINGSADYYWLIEATRPVSAGVQTNRAPFCIINNTQDTTALPTSLFTPYFKRYTFAPVADQVIFTRISAIHFKDGWRTPSQVLRSVVTT